MLITAQHTVYGEVAVPKTYLDLYPDDYSPVDQEPAQSESTYDDWTVNQLDAELRSRDLPTTGKKAEKVARLNE